MTRDETHADPAECPQAPLRHRRSCRVPTSSITAPQILPSAHKPVHYGTAARASPWSDENDEGSTTSWVELGGDRRSSKQGESCGRVGTAHCGYRMVMGPLTGCAARLPRRRDRRQVARATARWATPLAVAAAFGKSVSNGRWLLGE